MNGFKKKFILTNENEPNETISFAIKQWCITWNKIAAFTFAFFTFFIFFAMVMCNILNNNKHTCPNNCSSVQYINSNSRILTPKELKCQLSSNCKVICNNFVETEEHKLADEIALVVGGCYNIQVYLDNCRFISRTLTDGWLSLETNTYSIKKLYLNNLDVDEFGEGAFTGRSPINNLDTLVITNTKIRTLRKNTFRDLRIETFAFRFDVPGVLTVEAGALSGIEDYVNSLEFKGCLIHAEAIQNLTGDNGVTLRNLEIIDFSGNSLSHLGENSFSKLFKCKSLYLNGNNLMWLDPKTFGKYSNYESIHLSNNGFKTLTKDIFLDIVTNEHSLYLPNKTLKCNCSLKWLQEYYIKTNYINKPLLCSDGRKIEDVDFDCDDENETTLSSTLFTATESTTQDNDLSGPGLIQVYCKNSTYSRNFSNVSRNYLHLSYITDQNIRLKFYELDQEDVEIYIEVEESLNNVSLFWFNNMNRNDRGCIINLDQSACINNLIRNQEYTLCLLNNTARIVFPFDCIGLFVPIEKQLRTWIPNKYQITAIGSVVGSLIFAALITAFIVFYCIRQHPSWIKGNKRVIIVESKAADAIVMPKYYEGKVYVAPSMESRSQGYLTPKFHKYARVRNRPREIRSVSGCNVVENRVSYVDVPSTSNYYNSIRLMRQRNTLRDLIRLDYENIYESPPLPPNHPLERRIHVDNQEVLVNSI